MEKQYQFTKQVLNIQTMGLTVYCETEFGQYRNECEAIDKSGYQCYANWAERGGKWGHNKLGTGDECGVTFVASLPKRTDGMSVVSFCAGLALATVSTVCPNSVSIPMVSRLAGVIFNNLQVEEVEP